MAADVSLTRAPIPALRYPSELPIVERREDILRMVGDHQVVIVAGETGSGKTTQLPKMCLELGRGEAGLIGHTQPRRIAARAVAERIAEELDSPLGAVVGYTVRFHDQISDTARVKVMTDGILLAELRRDRMLSRYDTIIIDEAHERSLNIDFLLGYVETLLSRRPDLKLIVTSATIDTERFSAHFGGAPIVEVSGRTYPVDVRYAPIGADAADDRDQTQAICDAVEECISEGPGDVLVFLSGEREIRDTADALDRLELAGTEILPLYARLSGAAQHRVFAPHPGRRVVLATNVAETSLTVPGIRFVVDPGTARISRFNRRTKVQRLPIEAVSQASADQRAGRCGRIGPGVCIRLYDEADFTSRPRFTEPEILRTNLASVILQMAALGLGDPTTFPFLDPPDIGSISDGIQLLDELGALRDPSHGQSAGRDVRLTDVGRKLAQLPIDPRVGRMIIEAGRQGALREVLVIAAGLSIQDPRERPLEERASADALHARFRDPDSDFLSYLNLWNHLRDRREERSSSQFRKLCRAEYLNYLRVREWQDLHSQLRQVARELKLPSNSSPASRDSIHQSILAGLLSHVGMHDPVRLDYLAARDARFAIAPGSALQKKTPRWVMAAELVETDRLRARVVARIDPAWAERVGSHLLKRTYQDPHWDAERGSVVAIERITLFGLPVVAGRRVDYGRIDPILGRELFIRHALIQGDWNAGHQFVAHNNAIVDQVRALEARVRRPGLLVDEEVVYRFFDERLPTRDGRSRGRPAGSKGAPAAGIVSTRTFDRWWRDAVGRDPALLDFSMELLIDPAAGPVDLDGYPDSWDLPGLHLRLRYTFEPGSPEDGVTVDLPVEVLNQLDPAAFEWHVPGYRRELVTALIRSLPKAVRRSFAPAAEHADAFLASADPASGPLLDQLATALSRRSGEPVPATALSLDRIPEHLRITFRVVDAGGRVLGRGKDLRDLARDLAAHVHDAVAAAGAPWARPGQRVWGFGEIPRRVEIDRSGYTIVAYPGLVDEGDRVAVGIFDDPAARDAEMVRGTRRLLLLNLPPPAKAVQRALTNESKLALGRGRHESVAELLADCIHAAVDHLVAAAEGPAWDGVGFDALQSQVRAELTDTAVAVTTFAGRIVQTADRLERRLSAVTSPALREAVTDMADQLETLVHPGFVAESGADRLPDVLRYLRGIEHRLERLGEDPVRDRERTRAIRELMERHERVRRARAGADEIRWLIEELRISLFAQPLRTRHPVSAKRIVRELERASGGTTGA